MITIVKREVVMSRIDKLKEYLAYLKSVQGYSREEYKSNPLIYGSTERFLHLVIECALDIGNHLIADLNLRKPESNKAVFEVLHENKIIGEGLLESLKKMAQFRNILVHDYIKIDREIVYDIVMNNFADFEDFVGVTIDYI